MHQIRPGGLTAITRSLPIRPSRLPWSSTSNLRIAPATPPILEVKHLKLRTKRIAEARPAAYASFRKSIREQAHHADEIDLHSEDGCKPRCLKSSSKGNVVSQMLDKYIEANVDRDVAGDRMIPENPLPTNLQQIRLKYSHGIRRGGRNRLPIGFHYVCNFGCTNDNGRMKFASLAAWAAHEDSAHRNDIGWTCEYAGCGNKYGIYASYRKHVCGTNHFHEGDLVDLYAFGDDGDRVMIRAPRNLKGSHVRVNKSIMRNEQIGHDISSKTTTVLSIQPSLTGSKSTAPGTSANSTADPINAPPHGFVTANFESATRQAGHTDTEMFLKVQKATLMRDLADVELKLLEAEQTRRLSMQSVSPPDTRSTRTTRARAVTTREQVYHHAKGLNGGNRFRNGANNGSWRYILTYVSATVSLLLQSSIVGVCILGLLSQVQ